MKPRQKRHHTSRFALPALTGLVVLAATLLGLGQLSPSSTAAEPPAAQDGYATVGLYVGGDRDSATSIGPLGGVTFGFFTTRPTAYNETTGMVTGATPARQCTSTPDGWCNLTVQIGTGSGQVTSGTRYWVAPVSGPAGWYGNPYFQTAPLTGATARLQTQHIFQTPALVSGSRFVSSMASSGFLDDPGTTVSDTAFMNANGGSTGSGTTSNNFQRRTASGGTWPLSRANPPLPSQCGLNVALVVDLSASVMTPTNYLPQLKAAMDTFVNALQGTPSQLSITTFGTGSPAAGYPGSNTGLLPVASSANANAVKALYANWPVNTTNYTNWDAGLSRVAQLENASDDQHIDLAVVLTDGNPTVYGNTGAVPANSGFTRFREMENSIASANEVKSLNTRVLAVGVGDGLDAGSARNLRSISGPTKYAGSVNIDDADYLQEANYDAAGTALRQLVVGACAPSISVIKQIIPNGGTIADAYTPAEPWTFTATAPAGGTVGTPGAATATQDTDEHTGGTNFDVTLPPSHSGTYGVAETQKPGYALYPVNAGGTAAGTQNATCVDKTNDDAVVPVTNTSPTGFSVDLGVESAISCIVYNQAPDYASASVVVHKRWAITVSGHTTTYDQYEQPDGLNASLRLSGPGGAGLTTQTWSDPRSGYHAADPNPAAPPADQVTIAEELENELPGCTFDSATMTGTGITGSVDLGTGSTPQTTRTVTAGANAWTITNAFSCRSQLTLVKTVRPGFGASPSLWTLTAHAASGALTGPSGTTGTPAATADVSPDRVYQLSEATTSSDPELLNYVQTDRRPRPIQWPLSTGSADCAETDGGPGDPQGLDGSVAVGLGRHVTCVLTNSAAPLRVIKRVEGGTASPGDFRFTLEPVAPFPAGLPSRHFTGMDAPGASMLVRPDQTYRLSEDGPDGYQMSQLACAVRTPRSALGDITVPAGSSMLCTVTNSYSTWYATKSSNPASGAVISPGDVITYTLTAHHDQGAPTQDVLITDDLSKVLDHATFLAGSINASAGTAQLVGHEIRWTIPTLSDTETVSYQVRVDPDAWGVTISNKLTTMTTTRPGQPDPGEDCEKVTGHPDCDETTHTTPPGAGTGPGAGGALPGTGGPRLWLLLGGGIAVCAGGTFLAAARSRRRRL